MSPKSLNDGDRGHILAEIVGQPIHAILPYCNELFLSLLVYLTRDARLPAKELHHADYVHHCNGEVSTCAKQRRRYLLSVTNCTRESVYVASS